MTTDPLLAVAPLTTEPRPEILVEHPDALAVSGVAVPLPKDSANQSTRPWLGIDFGYTVVAR